MPANPTQRQLGTFLGVFTPSILTILGVVLFLRTGWVVGQVGLVPALLIILLAHSITVATSFSVSAVATNMHVGAGGAYYILSRSLGLEIGGAIGIPLFLAQTFSVTLYAFGVAESLELFWPGTPQRAVAALTVLAVSALAARSASLALKAQLPILVAIGLALASLIVGATERATGTLPLWEPSPDSPGFWTVFAVFFPAVTGIMAGISLSGDLKNPARSIPRGTLGAVIVGLVVYLAVPIVLASAATPEALATDSMVWFRIGAVPWLIIPGLLGAILSSAIGSILGAPRTLEALANDRVVPAALARHLVGPRGKGLSLLASAAVALAAVLLGDLNAVAPVLTMFFLTTYGMVNLVAGLEQLSGSPSYRPAIHVPWFVSLLGAVGCIWVMGLINPLAAVVAVLLEILVYVGLRRRALTASWGDLRHGALLSLTRATLLKIRRLPSDPRNWRPHILVFAGDPKKRLDLIRFADWLNQKRGILTVSHLLIGNLEELAEKRAEETALMDRFLEEQGITAFAEAEVVPDFEVGVLGVCQANGIAGITSNTLMMGWTEKEERLVNHLRIVRQAGLLGKSTILCRIAPRRWSHRLHSIDVWWGGLQNNGDMMLLFAHLLSLNPEWAKARLSIKTVASNAMTHEQTRRSLEALVERCRINAETFVLERPPGANVQDLIQLESAEADLVFLGLQRVAPGEEAGYARRLRGMVGDLPTVMLVHASGPFAGQLL